MNKIIVSRAPMRISFVGGGTDIKDFYKIKNGEVFSLAIKKYVYLVLNEYHDPNRNLIKYSMTEKVGKKDKIKHNIFRNAIKKYNAWGIDFNSIADIPAGTGLGSSSSFCVSLINAIKYFKNNQLVSKNILAKEACNLEINLCKYPIGKQDQYISSFGGLCSIKFKKDEKVIVEKINNKKTINNLVSNCLIFNTNVVKDNFKILKDEIKNFKRNNSKFKILEQIKSHVKFFENAVKKNDVDTYGDILDSYWENKKKLSNYITNSKFDELIDISKQNGAIGSKIIGAGGRGYLLVIAKKNNHKKIKNGLKKLQSFIIEPDLSGAKIIYKG